MLTINFKSVSILSQSTKYSASLVGGQTTTYTTVLLTFKMFSVCKDFFIASMRRRLLVELSQV